MKYFAFLTFLIFTCYLLGFVKKPEKYQWMDRNYTTAIKGFSINVDVHEFDNFVWYDASTDFERVDDTTFTISTSAFGILGIDYTYESGDNKADIYVDGELFESPTVTFDYDFSQRHILVVSDDCTVKNEIKVVFNTKEQADGFKGMCFSWE